MPATARAREHRHLAGAERANPVAADLRYTSATLAIAAGASTKELMQRLGHSTPAAALRYQHAMEGRDAAIAAALDQLVQADGAPVLLSAVRVTVVDRGGPAVARR